MSDPTCDALVPLLSVDAVADVLSVSPDTVKRMVRRGELPVVRVGRLLRVQRSEVAAYIEMHSVRRTT